jgi:hypothetical protein
MSVFRDIPPCSLVEVGRRFGGVYSLHHHHPDTSVSPDETKRHSVTEDSHFNTRHRENLKSHQVVSYFNTFWWFACEAQCSPNVL